MTKRTAFLAALAAAATLFLTACNQNGSAAGTKEDTANEYGAQQVAGDDDEPVDCGEVEVNGSTQKLIAIRANGGIVGCTEAFNVLDEYLTKGTPMLSDGWACAPDDAFVACVKGDAQDPAGLGFHTESDGGTPKPGPEPVNCGEVTVDGSTHTLTAQPAADGIVGCTEAFNVIDEYLRIPAAERGANLNGTDLANGWSCATDDGEVASIGCVKDPRGDEYAFAFATHRA